MFKLLETQRLLNSKATITLIPPGAGLMAQILATQSAEGAKKTDA